MEIDRIRASFAETAGLLARLQDEAVLGVRAAGEALAGVVRRGGKILLCGNGGSAADAQHVATELCVRYVRNRRALPALALTVDTSILTACANDFGFERVFARQVEAIGNAGDALVAISTSGNSANVLAAADEARARRILTVALTGSGGGALGRRCDHWIAVPAAHTPRIQEALLVVEHVLCEIIEEGVE